MGLKLRLGLALSGLLMSSMFGVDMLTGIKDYVDTTGNIMVDIADGIGMISKGLEYLESYLDPQGNPTQEKQGTSGNTPPPGGTVEQPVGQPPIPTVFQAEELDPEQPAVLCQGSKCYPYDPNKVKNPKLTLEAKPGMILTPQQPEKSEKSSKFRKGKTEDLSKKQNHKQGPNIVKENHETRTKSTKQSQQQPTIKVIEPLEDPLAPTPTLAEEASENVVNIDSNQPTTTANDSVTSAKKIITASRGLLDNLSKLLVRLVNRMFPWNRRARRRLSGDDDEL